MSNVRQPRYRQIFRDDEDRAELAAKIWRDTIAHLREMDLLTEARAKVADRYVRAYVEYEALYPSAAAEGPVKVGPNGGDVFNQNWTSVERLNERLLKLEDALCISPKAAAPKERKPDGRKTPASEFLGGLDNRLRQ